MTNQCNLTDFHVIVDSMKIKDRIFNNPKLKGAFSEMKSTLFAYLKAMLIMFAVNLAVSCLGLAVLEVGWWSFPIALGIAAVDLLPIFGSGVVLIPWSVYSFCADDYKKGVGLIVIFVLLLLVKFLLEPIVCGKKIGLTGVETLVFSLLGVLLFGASGIITGPVFAVGIRILVKHLSGDSIQQV